MVGYVARPAELGVYLASYFLFQVTSESIGVLCAAATRTSTTAVLLLTFVLLILLSFSGFLVSDIPPYFKWVRTVSFLTYAYAAVVTSQFDATDFVCTTGPPACPELGLVIPGSQLIPAQVVTGLSVGGNLAVLLGIAAGARLAAFGSVWTAHRLKFL
jgi:ABC-type transport system involved in multi-copper enzyme maturation permease subunit